MLNSPPSIKELISFISKVNATFSPFDWTSRPIRIFLAHLNASNMKRSIPECEIQVKIISPSSRHRELLILEESKEQKKPSFPETQLFVELRNGHKLNFILENIITVNQLFEQLHPILGTLIIQQRQSAAEEASKATIGRSKRASGKKSSDTTTKQVKKK
jgi:hypothetical protein